MNTRKIYTKPKCRAICMSTKALCLNVVSGEESGLDTMGSKQDRFFYDCETEEDTE